MEKQSVEFQPQDIFFSLFDLGFAVLFKGCKGRFSLMK